MPIVEHENPVQTIFKPIKENMNCHINDIINKNIPNRNGMIVAFCGSGGCGKTSLLLNMIKHKDCYRAKFHHIIYFCPQSSFLSVKDHPFAKPDENIFVFHELNSEILESVYDMLQKWKRDGTENEDMIYNLIIIDDYADALKDIELQRTLNKLIIKARHLCTSFFFTLQSYSYFPKICRKQLTNLIQFRPQNKEEWEMITNELVHLEKQKAASLYAYVYDKNYNHLHVNLKESDEKNIYFKNFNALEII